MRIHYDTEFIEDGRTIDLISIGMVTDDGRELYAINRDAPWERIRQHSWLMDNVVPSLPQADPDAYPRPDLWMLDYAHPAVHADFTIPHLVKNFIRSTPDPELWAWYGAYDHVALAQLFGPMIELPDGIPMWTNDLRQEAHRLGNPALPDQPEGEHNALADARHNRARAHHLDKIARDAR